MRYDDLMAQARLRGVAGESRAVGRRRLTLAEVVAALEDLWEFEMFRQCPKRRRSKRKRQQGKEEDSEGPSKK